ncbi:MAG TPA: regulatory iron-sulfur-containing complex subunit RicT [Candidatus Binataceae bacterium]|nr:regulatory iron-sulfur-containing complex subunit RicT [Candidatus Binataceae bacterium]
MSELDGIFGPAEDGPMVVGVSLQPVGHIFNYLSGGIDLKRGDRVVVETDAGACFATVTTEPCPPSVALDLTQLRPVLRIANDSDLRIEEENRYREQQARRLCVQGILQRGLEMKLVNVGLTYDGRKAVFYFVAEKRVDFRNLVRDLANALRLRVEMQQIGARDETKATGGIGPCGRELCCSSWLRDFEAVTVKMAREQGLALNPSRLAGMCGRLKCCLRYEYATYVELKRGLPAVGKRVESVKGNGKVLRQNILKQTVLIQVDEEGGGVIEATMEDIVEKRAQ